LTKLEKRAEQILPGSTGFGGEEGGRRHGEEMAQTIYAYMNKRIKKKKENVLFIHNEILFSHKEE
jgi:hypothetical protein